MHNLQPSMGLGRTHLLIPPATSNSQETIIINQMYVPSTLGVQELCGSRGGRPGLPVLMSLVVSVDVKQH